MGESHPHTGLRQYKAIGEAELVGQQRKRAVVRGRELLSDEGTAFGGLGEAPTAMDYFVAAIMF